MTVALQNALIALTGAVNHDFGALVNAFDMDAGKETFKILHENGEILLKQEIEAWASQNGWKKDDAEQVGSLAQQIGEGKKVRITGASSWAEGIYQRWNEKNASSKSNPKK